MADQAKRLLEYDLKTAPDVDVVPLSLQQFCSRFAAPALTAPFHAVVLGDFLPQAEPNLVAGYTTRNEWAVWCVERGPGGTVGSLLVMSMTSGVPLVHVLPPAGKFSVAAWELGVVVLAEAAFRYQPSEAWVLTAMNAPAEPAAEDLLTSLGFELVASSFDVLGRVTYGVRRAVFAELWQELAP